MDACALPGGGSDYYAITLAPGYTLYNDSAMTTPAGPGYYSDGTVWYDVQFGGLILTSGSC